MKRKTDRKRTDHNCKSEKDGAQKTDIWMSSTALYALMTTNLFICCEYLKIICHSNRSRLILNDRLFSIIYREKLIVNDQTHIYSAFGTLFSLSLFFFQNPFFLHIYVPYKSGWLSTNYNNKKLVHIFWIIIGHSQQSIFNNNYIFFLFHYGNQNLHMLGTAAIHMDA